MNVYVAQVLRVLDGDTFEALIHLGFGVVQLFRIRLEGVDTPELKGKTKAAALRAKEALRNLIEGKNVFLRESAKKDKYGRALARVETAEGQDLTEYLLKHRLGKKYDGGKKSLLPQGGEWTIMAA